jgi:hypothetical protein
MYLFYLKVTRTEDERENEEIEWNDMFLAFLFLFYPFCVAYIFFRYMNPTSTTKIATIHLFFQTIVLQFVIMVFGIVVNVISEAEELVYDANEIKRVI